jgi:hypothetical protein
MNFSACAIILGTSGTDPSAIMAQMVASVLTWKPYSAKNSMTLVEA